MRSSPLVKVFLGSLLHLLVKTSTSKVWCRWLLMESFPDYPKNIGKVSFIEAATIDFEE